MKKYIVWLFCLSMGYCFAQNPYKLREDQLRRIENREIYVNNYVDSLNSYNYLQLKKIPRFFYISNIDRQSSLWIGLHQGISLRKLIIDRITNIPLLEAVLKDKDRRLRKKTKVPKKHYIGHVVIPFQEYSTYELVQYRLQELINEDIMGKGASNYPYPD
jgi:hypothetical protein